MKNALRDLLYAALGNKQSATISLLDIERVGGEDWLLDVNEQALRLNARIEPHAKDLSLATIMR